MLTIKGLKIQGFKSFGKEQIIDFNIFALGSYSVIGDNGVGKSTIFEAICWILFGKISTKLKADNIKSWYSEEKTKGTIFLNIEDKEYELTREFKPNKLILNGQDISQEELENNILDRNFESFLYSVFISQFSNKFFDLKPEAKLVLLSEILNLGKWELLSTQARVEYSQVQFKIDDKELLMSNLEGQLKILGNIDYTKDIEGFKKETRKTIKLKKEAIQLIQDKIEKKEIKEQELEEEKKGYDPNKNKKKNERNRISLTVKRQRRDQLIPKYEDIRRKKERLQNEISKLKISIESDQSTCIECLQKIDKKILRDKKKEVKLKLDEALKGFDKAKEQIITYNAKIKKVEDSLKKQDADDLRMKYSLQRVNNDLKNIDKDIGNLNVDIKEIKNEIRALRKKENPFINKQKQNNTRILNTGAALAVEQMKLKKLNKESDIFKYWIKGFKDIRLFVLESAILELEIEVNNHLECLGLEGWAIKLSTDYETKKGDLKKGFTVLIQSPINDDLKPFACWSGGEAQKLKLAGTLGLMDLINNRYGSCNLEIWDEATSWLSDEGIFDYIKVLTDRGKESDKLCFIIDHRDLLSYGEFEGSLNVNKKENQTYLNLVT